MTFPATGIASDALPMPDEVQLLDRQPILRTPWPKTGGAIQFRDRRPNAATALEALAVWLTIPHDAVDAFRLHHRTYYTGAPWTILVPCDSAPWRVTYAGPLSISPISAAFSRVSVLLARSLPATT